MQQRPTCRGSPQPARHKLGERCKGQQAAPPEQVVGVSGCCKVQHQGGQPQHLGLMASAEHREVRMLPGRGRSRLGRRARPGSQPDDPQGSSPHNGRPRPAGVPGRRRRHCLRPSRTSVVRQDSRPLSSAPDPSVCPLCGRKTADHWRLYPRRRIVRTPRPPWQPRAPTIASTACNSTVLQLLTGCGLRTVARSEAPAALVAVSGGSPRAPGQPGNARYGPSRPRGQAHPRLRGAPTA